MSPKGPFDQNDTPKKHKAPSSIRIRNAVILPDGSKREPLGSGVITGILGIGGMANVYEIWNSQLEIARAVKLLHPNYTEETKQRFQTEIKITAKLHHPNIIEIHAVGYWNRLPYIEMERIEGDTLDKLIQNRGALPVEVCTAIGIMIGRALKYAHNQEYVIYGKNYHGVIHRDLKPSNIMVPGNGIVKLMDFGIARPTDASIHTTDGAILGTMQYLSPEQLDGKEPDIRTDIYSLGTILYEILTGVKAFPDQNVSRLMLSKIKNDFNSLDQFDLKIPSRLRRLIHRCMVYDREKRIPDAETFLSEIGKIHRTLCPFSPEQVVTEYLLEENVSRTVISTRHTLPKKTIVAGLLMALLSLGIWQGGRLINNRLKESEPVNKNTSVLPEVTVEDIEKKAPSVESGTKITAKKEQVNNIAVKRNSIAATDKRPKKSSPSTVIKSEKPQKSFVDLMQEKYGTTNLLKLYTMIVQRRQWQEADKIYKELDPKDASSPRAVIYRIRTLRALGKIDQLQAFLAATTIEDGEIYLERAKCAFNSNNITAALNNLKSCERTTSAFMESASLRLERLYLEALCAEKQFKKNSSESTKKYALDRWFEVKSELRTSRDHPWFKEADEHMQRIISR